MKDVIINLAKKAVKEYLETGNTINPPKGLPEKILKEKAGVFVSIYKTHQKPQIKTLKTTKKELRGLPRSLRHPVGVLRGCIGTFLPTKENIAQEIIANSILAVTKDPRFEPVVKDEFSNLKFSIDILEPPETIKDIKKHHPKKHGLIVKCQDGRCGLLLPDIDGVDTLEQQYLICCQKGNIDPLAEKPSFYSFNVKRYQES